MKKISSIKKTKRKRRNTAFEQAYSAYLEEKRHDQSSFEDYNNYCNLHYISDEFCLTCQITEEQRQLQIQQEQERRQLQTQQTSYASSYGSYDTTKSSLSEPEPYSRKIFDNDQYASFLAWTSSSEENNSPKNNKKSKTPVKKKTTTTKIQKSKNTLQLDAIQSEIVGDLSLELISTTNPSAKKEIVNRINQITNSTGLTRIVEEI